MQTAAILIIGNEMLSGRTRDLNLQTLGTALAEHGIRVRESRVVEDRFDSIVQAVNSLRATYDLVFTTGGIGPTHDDITTDCIAAALGRVVVENPEAVRRLTAYYPHGDLNQARLKMARIVVGAELLDNPVSAAPGYRVENVFVLPGVPRILQSMLPGLLARLHRGTAILSRSVTAYLRESEIAAELEGIQLRYPMLDLGSYPFVRDGRFGTTLVARGTAVEALASAIDEIAQTLAVRNAEFVVESTASPL
ncbi:MAG: competence/damage-inducible protein A [Gammaproteobacteria bacterium]|nr:competence/damage-inducible protein A [Gammaproteobacteria bacterium]